MLNKIFFFILMFYIFTKPIIHKGYSANFNILLANGTIVESSHLTFRTDENGKTNRTISKTKGEKTVLKCNEKSSTFFVVSQNNTCELFCNESINCGGSRCSCSSSNILDFLSYTTNEGRCVHNFRRFKLIELIIVGSCGQEKTVILVSRSKLVILKMKSQCILILLI
jgi:hypothetical protein